MASAAPYDEQGRFIPNASFWTGTLGGGTVGFTCGGWTLTSGSSGTSGSAGTTSTAWTSISSPSGCSSVLSLLCFEQ